MNLVSGSLIFAPTFEKNHAVTGGSFHSVTAVTITNATSHQSYSANSRPNARTVPRSVMKQAARMILPSSVALYPRSIITA